MATLVSVEVCAVAALLVKYVKQQFTYSTSPPKCGMYEYTTALVQSDSGTTQCRAPPDTGRQYTVQTAMSDQVEFV